MADPSATEMLAMLAHADLKDGQAVVRLDNRWITLSIKEINIKAQEGFINEITLTGYQR